ncbi:MAG: glycoside hydrolase family 19 protein [Candidatus Acidiferrales bacterium]|jgi:hypothetical protein
MPFPLTPERIAEILGSYVDPKEKIGDRQVQGILRANVPANWPRIEAALVARGIYSDLAAVATIATVSVETLTFAPVKERGGPAYLADLYEGRKDLGNTAVGDGARFRGRGFVQITGRWDYTHFGQELGRDLAENPDLALDPQVAAEILALYFHERAIPSYADAENWQMVRRRVNGGLNGWPRFMDAITKLTAALRPLPIGSSVKSS